MFKFYRLQNPRMAKEEKRKEEKTTSSKERTMEEERNPKTQPMPIFGTKSR